MTENNGSTQDGFTRRDFVKTGALLGSSAALAAQMPWLLQAGGGGDDGAPRYLTRTEVFGLAWPVNIFYTVCQQCNSQCGIKV